MADKKTKEKGSLSIHTENIFPIIKKWLYSCLLYSSDAADELRGVALGGCSTVK